MNSTETSNRGRAPALEIAVRDYDHPDARRLVRALFDEQVERYGYADPPDGDAATYAPPAGLFVVGYLHGEPVVCGGYRIHDVESRTVEIKKMYSLPETRGSGLGRLVLTELQRRAVLSGARRAILETGVRNRAALRLYTGMGYVPTARYAKDRDPRINRAFIKCLAP